MGRAIESDLSAFSRAAIALEGRLRACRNVVTLGVRPNFEDYPPESAELIRRADKIYYPSSFYAALLDAAGKKLFPSCHTYQYSQDKIKQSALFNLLRIPHPRTRVFYGRRQKARILQYFKFPFVAKVARGSALGRGVFLIRNTQELENYCRLDGPAYIQTYLASKRDIRVVVMGDQVVHAYWRQAAPDDFRTNLGVGGSISLDPAPPQALALAEYTARKCRWDDVGIDILPSNGQFYVLEANMKYGKQGFRYAGIDYIAMVEQMIETGKI